MANSGIPEEKNFHKDIEIGAPSIFRDNDQFLTVSYPIASPIFPDKLVFKVNAENEGFIDQSLNCALVALILPAMRSGSRIILNGPVSEKLLFSCQGNLQSVVSLVLGYEPVSIVLNDYVTRGSALKSTYTATGFSGGVDSYSILKDHYFKRDQSQSGINCLVFNNIGANGTTDELALFEKRLQEARKGASAVGLPLVVVESNMDDFYSVYPDLHFFKTHSFRNASVAHLLSNTISSYLYAAARTYSEVRVEPSETIGNVDPITLPLLSSEHMDIQSEGARYSRSEKIKALVDYEIVQKNLYVCVDHNHVNGNCSICQKCVRTLLVIDFLGRLEDFSNTFDLNRYLKVRNERLLYALVKNDSFGKDLRHFISRSEKKLPLFFLAKLKLLTDYNRAKRFLKLVLTIK